MICTKNILVLEKKDTMKEEDYLTATIKAGEIRNYRCLYLVPVRNIRNDYICFDDTNGRINNLYHALGGINLVKISSEEEE